MTLLCLLCVLEVASLNCGLDQFLTQQALIRKCSEITYIPPHFPIAFPVKACARLCQMDQQDIVGSRERENLHHISAEFRHISPVRGQLPIHAAWKTLSCTFLPLHVSGDLISSPFQQTKTYCDLQQPARDRCDSRPGLPAANGLDSRRSRGDVSAVLRGASGG